MKPANEAWFKGLARDVGDPALSEVHAAFDELLFLPDHDAVNVTLAGVVANYATGDAVWPLLLACVCTQAFRVAE